MANEHLDNLVRTGGLKAEAAMPGEISGLIRSGVARLRDAKNADLNLESRFDLAYNAAHALSLAALRMAGYRSNNRYLVFQCLRHTLDFPNEKWRVLDQAHRKRNIAEYEGASEIDTNLVEALIRVTGEIAARVSDAGAASGRP
ncbi:MAG: hypothetical protein F4092_04490 [Rhodospirillaceae bacterium]|nr:hypothetical protein [Rhodospirillaceae bacterium]MYJ71026.1 hypothetical protein [Rhodospirillaceae bacterium]